MANESYDFLREWKREGAAGEPIGEPPEVARGGSAWTGMDGLQPEQARGGTL